MSIPQRRVSTLCSEGRVIGATMVGSTWIIPHNAIKPIDARTREAEKNDEAIASMAEDLIKSSKVDVKNEILRLLLSNLEISRKKISFNLLEPFCYIKKSDSRPMWLPRPDSNWQPRS